MKPRRIFSALILTDSLHLPTTIGYFNTRPAACQARQSAHAWLKGESQSVESLKCFSNAAMNILDQCRTAIEKNPAHYAEFAKLAESGTITRSQFETFAYHAVNSPLPNENFTDLNALADTLRKALDEGTQIIL